MTVQTPQNSSRLVAGAGFFVLMVLCWVPWVLFQSQMRVSADAAWLIEAAMKVLDGQSMTDRYFDSNPPMSFLIYIPAAMLVKAGLPLWHALSVYTALLMSVSLMLCMAILRYWPGIKIVTYWGILSSWLLAITALSHFDFGQKDHFIAIMLLPFLLAQLMMTYRCSLPRWILIAALVAGLPFILLKPHYGLLAVAMLLFRASKQNRLDIFRDVDFIILGCGVVAYAGIVAVFFPDFVQDVLPFSMRFYVSVIFKEVYPLGGASIFLASCCTALAALGGERWNHDRALTVFLSVMGLLAGIVFFLQMKGFPLHLLPALSLVLPAMVATGLLYVPDCAERKGLAPVVIVAFAALASLVFMIEKPMLTHKSYSETSLAKYLKAHVPPDGSFYLQADSTNVIVPVSAYAGAENASRFPMLWFLSSLEAICARGGKSCQKNPEVIYFSRKVAEDIQQGKPAFIGLYAEPGPGEHFMRVLGENPEFQKEWKHYRPAGQYLLNYQEYYTGPLAKNAKPRLYNIYMRRQ